MTIKLSPVCRPGNPTLKNRFTDIDNSLYRNTGKISSGRNTGAGKPDVDGARSEKNCENFFPAWTVRSNLKRLSHGSLWKCPVA